MPFRAMGRWLWSEDLEGGCFMLFRGLTVHPSVEFIKRTNILVRIVGKAAKIRTELQSSFFFNSHSRGWSPNWIHLARRPLIGLLYLSRVIARMENLVEWRFEDWQGKQKYSEKTAPAPLCPPQIPLDQTPGSNPGRRSRKPATNRLSQSRVSTSRLGCFTFCDHMSFVLREVSQRYPRKYVYLTIVRYSKF
jgi:hypothetical protein